MYAQVFFVLGACAVASGKATSVAATVNTRNKAIAVVVLVSSNFIFLTLLLFSILTQLKRNSRKNAFAIMPAFFI